VNEVPKLLIDIDAEKLKSAFVELMEVYNSPAFGSITKKDFEISLFIKLQDIGVITDHPTLYEVLTKLKVTRTKARNLIYEANLWKKSTVDLNNELKLILKNPSFLNDGKTISISVENPLLQDHIKSILKSLKFITDGSFSSEILKLTTDAYVSLYLNIFNINDAELEIATNYFKESGLMTDLRPRAIITGIMKSVGQKYLGEIGSDIANDLSSKAMDFMESLATGNNIETSKAIGQALFPEKISY
jgi:hypothetical protein